MVTVVVVVVVIADVVVVIDFIAAAVFQAVEKITGIVSSSWSLSLLFGLVLVVVLVLVCLRSSTHLAGRSNRGGCHNREPSPTASPAHGLTTNGASLPTRQSTANTKLTRDCGRLGAATWFFFGVEVGGRVSRGTLTFLPLLARARARQRAP